MWRSVLQHLTRIFVKHYTIGAGLFEPLGSSLDFSWDPGPLVLTLDQGNVGELSCKWVSLEDGRAQFSSGQ